MDAVVAAIVELLEAHQNLLASTGVVDNNPQSLQAREADEARNAASRRAHLRWARAQLNLAEVLRQNIERTP